MSMGTILLVNGVKLHQEVLKEFLRLSPVRVVTAGNGAEALESARRELPDLIVMDMMMPEMDGLRCTAHIKGHRSIKALPVVLLGNCADPAAEGRCRRAGCNGYLPHPVLGKDFLDLLHTFLPAVERRKVRMPCSLPVTVKTDGEFVTGVSSDIGMGGLFVSSGCAIVKESAVVVSFRVPVSTYALTVVRGRVAWVKHGSDNFGASIPEGFGVEFLEILGEGLDRLRFGELSGYINSRRDACRT